MGKTKPFAFGNCLKIRWECSNVNCIENNLQRPFLKNEEDFNNEKTVIEYLRERYPSLIIDKVDDDYRFFFTKTDYNDFEIWCKSSVGERIESWVPREILEHAKKYESMVMVSLFDIYVYRHLYRIIMEKSKIS